MLQQVLLNKTHRSPQVRRQKLPAHVSALAWLEFSISGAAATYPARSHTRGGGNTATENDWVAVDADRQQRDEHASPGPGVWHAH